MPYFPLQSQSSVFFYYTLHWSAFQDFLRESGGFQEQNRWLPITTIRGRDQIQRLVAVAGLK